MSELPPRLPITIKKLSSNLMEVKVDHEVELTEAHVSALHKTLAQHAAGKPYAVLVDKTNHYSYSFAALRGILVQQDLFAIAFFIRSAVQRASLRALESVSAAREDLPMGIFETRTESLQWLRSQGAQVDEHELV